MAITPDQMDINCEIPYYFKMISYHLSRR